LSFSLRPSEREVRSRGCDPTYDCGIKTVQKAAGALGKGVINPGKSEKSD